jgi:hypothetical protein
MVLVFKKGKENYYLQKMRGFLANIVIFDRTDDRNLLGIFVKDLIVNRIGIFF